MAKADYYQLLGISPKASAEEIKKRYRSLARKYHPDATGNDKQAAEQFKQVQEAYETLSDPNKRKLYDQFGHDGQRMGGAQGPWSRQRSHTARGQGASFNVSDFFGGGGGFGDIFDQLKNQGHGGAPSAQQQPRRGKDIEHAVRIGFMEAVHGSTRDILMTINQPDGSRRRENISAKIPAGVEDGSKIRLRGKGQMGPNGNNGDLIIEISVDDHAFFKREGLDISLDVPLTVAEAALGTKIDVPTLTETTSVTIPPASNSGRKLRLKGKGVTSHKNNRSGDMYLNLIVTLPDALDEASAKLLEDFAERNPQADIRDAWK